MNSTFKIDLTRSICSCENFTKSMQDVRFPASTSTQKVLSCEDRSIKSAFQKHSPPEFPLKLDLYEEVFQTTNKTRTCGVRKHLQCVGVYVAKYLIFVFGNSAAGIWEQVRVHKIKVELTSRTNSQNKAGGAVRSQSCTLMFRIRTPELFFR